MTVNGATAATATADGVPPPANLLSIISSSSSAPSLHKSLKEWNDEIESTNFGLASLGAGAGGTAADLLEQVQPASEALHTVLVEEISSRAEVLACRCGHCGDIRGVVGEGGPDTSSSSSTTADDEQDAAARAAASSIRRYRRIGANANDSFASNSSDDLSLDSAAQTTSELLRAIKNVIRYTNSVRMMLGLDRFARGGAAAEDKEICDDPLRRLRSVGMLQVYQEVLIGCTCPAATAAGAAAITNASSRDDAARNASLAMFHACYGAPDVNLAATRARTSLVEEVGFIPELMRLLWRGTRADALALPPPLLLSLTRHVHSFVGCDPEVVPAMDKACRAIDDANNGKIGANSLVSVLVAILSATVFGGDESTRFPGNEICDRRPDLATEVLRILFALRATGAVPDPSSVSKDASDDASSAIGFDTMTRIGEVACHILKLPPSDRSMSTKLAAVNLLMDAPKGYVSYLLNEGAIPSLLLILRYQIDNVIERRTGSFNADAATLVPIFAVLDRLSADDNAVQRLVKLEVFPPSEEEAYQIRAAEERAKGGGGRTGLNAKNMQPALEAVPGTLRCKMTRLMTWPESNVKRCASELLWRLCNCDATEFVLRVGFGNAVHMLGIKGLVQVPSSSFG